MKNEEWRDVAGYEGRYQVSSMGRVKSLERKGRKSERILKHWCKFYETWTAIAKLKILTLRLSNEFLQAIRY